MTSRRAGDARRGGGPGALLGHHQRQAALAVVEVEDRRELDRCRCVRGTRGADGADQGLEVGDRAVSGDVVRGVLGEGGAVLRAHRSTSFGEVPIPGGTDEGSDPCSVW